MTATATKEKPTKTKRRFRLKRGGHVDPNASLIDSSGNTIKMGVRIEGRLQPNKKINGGRGFEPGDAIETEKDLVAMFGKEKFEEIDSQGVTVKPKHAINPRKFLDHMGIDDLRSLAESEEIDVSGLDKESEIKQRIVNVMG